MVEKIKRDVRITTIYEGTSEILEMTIARDRWQLHLKTRGEHYHAEARALEELARRHPAVGAGAAALALHALADLAETCRVARLTRHQHVLLRLGEWIAWAESAGAFARRAARAAEGALDPKCDRRFSPEGLATLARVFARDALWRVACDGARWAVGAGGVPPAELVERARLAAALAAQQGLIDDLGRAADLLYGRAPAAGAA
jgi:alkylation response protein AidB-like acyl-CoA dehydrogenase